VKQAEANSIESAIKKEVKMMEYVQDTMKSNQDSTHLMTFMWLRLVESKIEQGIGVNVIIDNPLFD
jgi:hypothetical protein